MEARTLVYSMEELLRVHRTMFNSIIFHHPLRMYNKASNMLKTTGDTSYNVFWDGRWSPASMSDKIFHISYTILRICFQIITKPYVLETHLCFPCKFSSSTMNLAKHRTPLPHICRTG